MWSEDGMPARGVDAGMRGYDEGAGSVAFEHEEAQPAPRPFRASVPSERMPNRLERSP